LAKPSASQRARLRIEVMATCVPFEHNLRRLETSPELWIGRRARAYFARGPSVLRVGFIGLGQISHENVLGYLDSPHAEVVAVCSRSESTADAWLARYELANARSYRDVTAMLEKEVLDLVEILTPHHLHYEQVMRCAQARVRGISLQKPMANRLAQCQEMIDACRDNGVVLKVYENFVFYPVFVKAKELIDNGLLGELISIRVNTMTGLRQGAPWPWPFEPDTWRTDLRRSGTGPLVGDDGFHKFSLARWFMRRDLERIGAWIDAETPLDAPAFVRGRFHRLAGEPAKYCQIDFSFSPRLDIPFDFWLEDFVEIVGERGIMWINQCSAAGDRALFRGNRMSDSPVFPPIAVYRDGHVTTYLDDISPSERNWSTSFIASTHHFIDVLRNGGEPIYTGEDGMEITRYAMAAIVSAQLGRDVNLDEITVETEASGRFEVTTNFLNLGAPGPTAG
jgi:predicted dehydrogenase